MGLDMYLYGDVYVGKDKYVAPQSYVSNPSYAKIIEALDLNENHLDGYGFSVHVPIGYWRKANAIHNWFINECAGGLDQCQEINVYQDKLTELKEICKRVIEAQHPDVANDLLPTASGFFFGSQEFDEYYYKDIAHTVDVIDSALALDVTDSFIYRASW